MTLKKPNMKEIRESMLHQLTEQGIDSEQNIDLVYDYVSLVGIKNKLTADIRKRGVTVEYDNGGGQKGVRKNDSCSQLISTNAQMLKILQHLNLDIPPGMEKGDDYEL